MKGRQSNDGDLFIVDAVMIITTAGCPNAGYGDAHYASVYSENAT